MTPCKYAVLYLFFLLIGSVNAQVDCEIVRSGNFVYEGQNEVYISIDGKWHKEFHQEGKYYILSKLKWVSECEYVAIIKKITVPNFPAKKGDKLKTRIISVDDNKISYHSTALNSAWAGEMHKLEELPSFCK